MDTNSPDQDAQPIRIWLFGLIMLVVVYLASPGPATWLVGRGWLSPNTYDDLCETVYAPLVWVDMNTSFFNENPVGVAYADYIDWFDQ